MSRVRKFDERGVFGAVGGSREWLEGVWMFCGVLKVLFNFLGGLRFFILSE